MTAPDYNDQITIDAGLMMHMLSGACRAGLDVTKLLQACGINPEHMNKPHARIPAASAVKLLHGTGYLMNDELVGLLAAPIPRGYFRQSVLCTVHQKNLGKALGRNLEFNNIFFNSLTCHLTIRGKVAEFSIKRDAKHTLADNVVIESVMAVFHRLAGWLCNELLIIDKVALDYSPPSYHKEYQYLFYGTPVNYNQKVNRLTFNAHYLDLPIVQNEASAESYIRRAPLDIFLPQHVRGDMSRAIRQELKEKLAQQLPLELQDMALSMEVSTQTIRRRLNKEGTSFNALKSQVRRDMAMHALGNPEFTIEEVAVQTGYSESAAFIRAFKNWTGISPTRFRKGVMLPGKG